MPHVGEKEALGGKVKEHKMLGQPNVLGTAWLEKRHGEGNEELHFSELFRKTDRFTLVYGLIQKHLPRRQGLQAGKLHHLINAPAISPGSLA